jgi:serine/threonine-protein kinase
VVDGRYRVDERVPRGERVRAYRATDLRLSRPVEIELEQALAGSVSAGADVERIRHRASLGSKLRHAGLAATLDGGHDASLGVGFLITEWLDGPDLAAEATAAGLASPAQVRARMLSVLEVLEWLHQHGVVYRALQPANVALVRKGDREAVVLRGLRATTAGEEPTITATCGDLGPWQFAAPELLWWAGTADARADVYSAAALLHFCLTGHVPYEDRTAQDVLARMRAGRLVPPRSIAPERVTPEWEAVVVRAMAYRAEDRFASAAEMAAAVSAAGT